MTKRSGALGIVFAILVSVPFILTGLGSILFALATHEIGRAVFGLAFTAMGSGVLFLAFRSRRSPEARAKRTPLGPLYVPEKVAPQTAYREQAPRTRPTAREAYALALPTLPLPVLPFAKGKVLPFALRIEHTVGPWLGIAFSVLWITFTAPFAASSLEQNVFVGLVVAAFAGVAALVGVLCIGHLLGRRRLASVEIAAEPTFAGEEVEIYIEQPGPLVLNHLKAHVRCEERVKYTVGTDLRTEATVVFEEQVVNEAVVKIERGERWSRHVRVAIPRELSSFKAPHNEIVWTIVLDADIANWPDYKEAFVFRVVPPIGRAA